MCGLNTRILSVPNQQGQQGNSSSSKPTRSIFDWTSSWIFNRSNRLLFFKNTMFLTLLHVATHNIIKMLFKQIGGEIKSHWGDAKIVLLLSFIGRAHTYIMYAFQTTASAAFRFPSVGSVVQWYDSCFGWLLADIPNMQETPIRFRAEPRILFDFTWHSLTTVPIGLLKNLKNKITKRHQTGVN